MPVTNIASFARGMCPVPFREKIHMKIKSVAAAVALLAAGLAQAAVVTVNAGAYSVTYDNATPGFGAISNMTNSGSLVQFEWSLQAAVQVQSFAQGSITATFAIPDFTITANPGWMLSGALNSTLGNVTYFEAGPAASTSLAAGATVTVDANPAVVLPVAPLPKVPSGVNTGWFAGATSFPAGGFSSLSITGGQLVLTANAGAGSFAAITGQPQNKLSFAFTANPVPEPETYALLLAGLGIVGAVARRRQQR